jgi:CO dehydrogenase maturation factor
VKIAIVGKGGAGKTTVAGTVARGLGRGGCSVLAVDADVNPMLGISLGVGPDRTEALIGARQALDAGEAQHQPTGEGVVEAFGTDAPDGVRLVVVSRIDTYDPG